MSPTDPTYLLCVFTKNEETTIESLAKEVRELDHQPQQVLVIDDSNDSTKEKIRRLNWVEIPGEGQLGSAYQKALKVAQDYETDFVVTMDGDGQADPGEIPLFLDAAVKQGADLVLGSRFMKEGLIQYSYPALNRFGVSLLSFYLSIETGQKITDSHGGIRCHSKRAVRRIEIFGKHTYVQESIVSAKQQGLSIIEIPSIWRVRSAGKSKVVGSVLRYVIRVTPQLLRCSRFNFFSGANAKPQ